MSYFEKKSLWTTLLSCSLFLLALSSCQKDFADPISIQEPIVEIGLKSYPGVEEELWPYFERFEIAAAEQNVEVDLVRSRITGAIEELEEENVAGLCTYYSHSPNHVTIDLEFWDRFNDNFKEMIIFHELGHCVLGRDHKEGQLTNGRCLSIMRSGIEPCQDAYAPSTKAYYINELFHPETVN